MPSPSSLASSLPARWSAGQSQTRPVDSLTAKAQLLQPDHAGRRRLMRRCVVLGGAALAAGLVDDGVAWRRLVADYRTEVGAQRHVTLTDGTYLLLNTRTAIDVDRSPDALHIRLLTGELLLEQQPGTRPVVIRTAQGEVQVREGRIVVSRQERTTEVDALAGVARVQSLGHASAVVTVVGGQHLSFTARATGQPVAIQHDRIAWVDGLIIARDMKLADFVQELQRYSAARLQCDPSVGSLLVSGNFPITDLKRVFAWLATTLPLRVEERDTQWGRQALTLRALG
ncbi:MAG: FecR domain-containing protein [Lautropia sp.]|nr:FecR domain-containing protein [Lautropia sp.]